MVAASVKGITQEQVEKIIELKLESNLGYREIGKRVGLKKDKVSEVWKKCEPLLALEMEASEKPEKPRDEGELYAEAFSFIERLWKEGLKAGDIAIGLAKEFKLVPDKAEGIVRKFIDLKELDLASLEENFIDMKEELTFLKQKFGLAVRHGKHKMGDCSDHYNKDDGTCRYWRWKNKPDDPWIRNDMVEDKGEWFLRVSEHPEYCATCEILPLNQRVKQLERDMKEVINGLNGVIDNLNVVTDTLAITGLMVKFRSIPNLK